MNSNDILHSLIYNTENTLVLQGIELTYTEHFVSEGGRLTIELLGYRYEILN